MVRLALLMATRRLSRRSLRTLLTVLEVALAALAATVALNLVHARALSSLPPGIFRVAPGPEGSLGYPLFWPSDLEKLKMLAPDVVALEVYGHVAGIQIEVNGRRFEVSPVVRVGPHLPDVRPLKLLRGAFFTESELAAGTSPLVMSETLARLVFGTADVVGRVVNVSNRYDGVGSRPYRVVGVVADSQQSTAIPSVNLYIPMPPASDTVLPQRGLTLGRASALVARARPGKFEAAKEQLIAAVRQVYRDDPRFRPANGQVSATTDDGNPFVMGQPGKPDPVLTIFASFAAVMLVVSSIGIFSIQLISAAERTRDIGMRRAVGASRAVILTELLLEAALVAGVGGILGVAGAGCLTPILQSTVGNHLFERGLDFSVIVALQVIGLILVVGVLLGLYPAVLASKLRPADALREV